MEEGRLFHEINEVPEYGCEILVQYESGNYEIFHYYDSFRFCHGEKIKRWCYIFDINKID